MDDFKLDLSAKDLPGPGEVVEVKVNHYFVLIENTRPPAVQAARPNPGDFLRYVPVTLKAPTSSKRHAAAVYQKNTRTRVNPFTLCDQSGKRAVKDRLDREQLTTVGCVQCWQRLVTQGALSAELPPPTAG